MTETYRPGALRAALYQLQQALASLAIEVRLRDRDLPAVACEPRDQHVDNLLELNPVDPPAADPARMAIYHTPPESDLHTGVQARERSANLYKIHHFMGQEKSSAVLRMSGALAARPDTLAAAVLVNDCKDLLKDTVRAFRKHHRAHKHLSTRAQAEWDDATAGANEDLMDDLRGPTQGNTPQRRRWVENIELAFQRDPALADTLRDRHNARLHLVMAYRHVPLLEDSHPATISCSWTANTAHTKFVTAAEAKSAASARNPHALPADQVYPHLFALDDQIPVARVTAQMPALSARIYPERDNRFLHRSLPMPLLYRWDSQRAAPRFVAQRVRRKNAFERVDAAAPYAETDPLDEGLNYYRVRAEHQARIAEQLESARNP